MAKRSTKAGICYLIHFSRKLAHAGHYLGFTYDLDARLSAHASGQGARLMAVINDAGIGWTVARTWSGNRKFERQLKNGKRAPKLCPLCAGDAAYQRAKKENNQ